MGVGIKRVHEAPSPDDGARVLVDGLWPRGLSRQRAALDEWARDLAPSTELRRWFGHEPSRFPEFRARYRAELAERPARLGELRRRAAERMLTLLYAARDERHNNAAVLAELIRETPAPGG